MSAVLNEEHAWLQSNAAKDATAEEIDAHRLRSRVAQDLFQRITHKLERAYR